jgi:hypothetical protein
MTDKLSLYNRALAHLKEERLVALTERRSPRFKLDDQWDGAVAYCLERGFWKFAMRSQKLFASSSASPAFGFQYAFEQPADLARLFQMSTDDRFYNPLQRFSDEAGYWYADFAVLYVRFVSNDPTYGLDLGRWPPSFVELLALRLASQAGPGISNDKELVAELRKEEKDYRIDAQSLDAMREPPAQPPVGSWVSSRFRGPMSGRHGGPGGW